MAARHVGRTTYGIREARRGSTARPVARWREVQDITGYRQALAEHLEREPLGNLHIQQSQEWLAWARARVVAIDLLRSLPPDSSAASGTDAWRFEAIPQGLEPVLP